VTTPNPALSRDGRYIAYEGQAIYSSHSAIWLLDLQGGGEVLASTGTGPGSQADPDGNSERPSIAGDGRSVCFISAATNLVPGDSNGHWDAFVFGALSGSVQRVNLSSSGDQSDDDTWGFPSMSEDGQHVIFHTAATTLVPADTNGCEDVFLRDLASATTERVSLAANGAQANGWSVYGSTTANNRLVVFESAATNLVSGDTNGVEDIFIRDRGLPVPHTYCVAKVSSLGCIPSIGWSGEPSLSGPDDFYATATNVINNKAGILIWGGVSASTAFFGGTLCIGPPIVRTAAQLSGGNLPANDCSGSYSFHFSHTYMAAQLLYAGTTVYAQYWSRDPGYAQPDNVGLTNGLRFTVWP
jgi:hypothetical protein